MKRKASTIREDKNFKLESIGFTFHELEDYWRESHYYEFNKEQVNTIKVATHKLHQMCLEAVDYVIKNKLMTQMKIPSIYHQSIIDSRNEPSLYGRFDFCYDGINPPKMFEYNADTPLSILEASLAQKQWQLDIFPQFDQYNSLHNSLINRWKQIGYKDITFTCLNHFEDLVGLNYLFQTALEANIDCDLVFLEEIKYDFDKKCFLSDKPISQLFKIYPYEWFMEEEFGNYLIDNKTKVIEPMWKSILSNKAILPILYQMFPDSEYLLPTYYDSNGMKQYCKKPFFSREGYNIEVVNNQELKTTGPYGKEGHIYQQYCELPCFDGFYPVVGSWIVGDEPCGLNIREEQQVITTYMSSFVPHIVV